MTALFARSLQASRVAVFQRLLPSARIRLVSLASRVAADLAARAVAAWRVIHGSFASMYSGNPCRQSSTRIIRDVQRIESVEICWMTCRNALILS